MNSITAVKQVGKAAAVSFLVCLLTLMSAQIRAQVTFSESGSYAHNNRPWQIAIGQFDNNNLLDVEMVTEFYDSGYRFAQSGNFYYIGGAGAGYNGIGGKRGVATADLDKDGTDDSIYINDNSLSTRYHNLDKGAGYWVEGATMVTVADVNMDTWMDVIVVKDNGEILTFINNRITPYTDGNGGFHSNLDGGYYKTDFPNEWIVNGAQAIAAGFIDNNGRWGLAIANADGNVYIYLPYNGGGFDEYYWALVDTQPVGNNPSSIAIGDIDDDNTLDIVTANTGDSTISVLTGLGFGTFRDAVHYNTGIAPITVAIGDCNGDDNGDVFVGNSGENSISYFLGQSVTSSPLGVEQTRSVNGPVYAINVGDFNQDNKLDIVYGALDGAAVSLCYGNGFGSFDFPSENGVFQGSVVATADLDGDTDLDIVALNPSDTVAIFENNGDGNFTKVDQFYFGGLAPNEAQALLLEDVDGDGDKDIVGTGFYRSLNVIKNLGGLNFGSRVRYEMQINSARMQMVDLNGDNRKDVILVDPGDNRIEILYNDGTGAFLSSVILTGAGDPWGIATGDLDGDGKADMVVSDRNNNRVTIWKGAGASFTFLSNMAFGNKPKSVHIADINGDGKRDLIATTWNPLNDDPDGGNDVGEDRVSVALGNGNGTFGAVSHYLVGRNPSWVQIVDLNFDGVLDLLIGNTWSWNTTALQGVGNGTFVNTMPVYLFTPSTGIFQCADVDGDALPDVIAGSSAYSKFTVFRNETPLMLVEGFVNLQGRPNPAGVQLTLEFRRNGSDEVIRHRATADSNGHFFIPRVIAGDYVVNVKPDNGLAINVDVYGENGEIVNIGTLTFRNGDATGDNAVDINDLTLLIAHYNQRKNTPVNNPNYLASVDFNNDDANDIGDLLIIISGYNQRGDQ